MDILATFSHSLWRAIELETAHVIQKPSSRAWDSGLTTGENGVTSMPLMSPTSHEREMGDIFEVRTLDFPYRVDDHY